jgi:hypothetical protein
MEYEVMHVLIIFACIALFLYFADSKILGEYVRFTLTLRELVITVLCSFSPIILDCIIKSWLSNDTFNNAFLTSFQRGEVFLYTSAFLSTFFVVYIKGNTKPPGLILSSVFFSALIGAFIYTFEYSAVNLNIATYAPPVLISILEVIIVTAVFGVWWWSTYPTYKNRGAATKETQKQQTELERKYEAHQKAD